MEYVPLSSVMMGGPGFRREGHVWFIAFGQQVIRPLHSKGLTYVHHLLQRRGTPVRVSELVQAEHAPRRNPTLPQHLGVADLKEAKLEIMQGTLGDAGDASDARTRRDILKRLKKLEDKRQDAGVDRDAKELTRIDREIACLNEYLNRNFDRQGRPRKECSDPDRQRKAAWKCITDAIRVIGKEHPELADHLQASIKTGKVCTYNPAEDPGWRFEW
jgi:hypothetical protein